MPNLWRQLHQVLRTKFSISFTFPNAFYEGKKTTKLHSFNYLFAFDTIFFSYLWWPFSFFSGATCFNRMPWPFTRFRIISILNSQIFGQKLFSTLYFQFSSSFSEILQRKHCIVVCLIETLRFLGNNFSKLSLSVQYFTNVNIVVCLIKNWQAQPLKYKCKRCKGDRFRKEFETQVIEIDIEF